MMQVFLIGETEESPSVTTLHVGVLFSVIKRNVPIRRADIRPDAENILFIAPPYSSHPASVAAITEWALTQEQLGIGIPAGYQELPSSAPFAIFDELIGTEELPYGAVVVSRNALLGVLQEQEIPSLSLLIALTVDRDSAAPTFLFGEESTEGILLSPAERAGIAKFLLEHYNIEDLLPSLSWEISEKESASEAYQTIAAHFIRWGEVESAKECLRLAEAFGESPRTLVLKAIVSQEEGNTLDAVAHLVSGLQGYEERKHPSEEHSTVFVPKDLDKLTSHLTEGLAALNRKDNSEALSAFAKAAFQFDSFFESNRVGKLLT